MADQTLGDRVGALEEAARSIALQLNGDPDLRIPGRLEQIERELAKQRNQIDQLTADLAATAARRLELRQMIDIELEQIEGRQDQTDRDHEGQLDALARRYAIVLILAIGNIIAGLIAVGVLYLLYLELVR